MNESATMPKLWPERVFVTWVYKQPVPVALTKLPDYMPVLKAMCVTGRRRDFTAMFSLS